MTNRSLTQRVHEHCARIGKALSSPPRLELIDLLAQGERPVEALAAESGMSVANTSHHLRALHDARLVETRRDGLHVRYRLAGADIYELSRAIRALAQRRIADVDRLVQSYLHERDSLEPVTQRDLLRRVRLGEVVVLDVRPVDEFAAGHIRGAVSIPLSELARRLAGLPRRKEIVAYCRGPYCLLALRAVETLRKRGFRARRLEDGFPEWRAAGLPVAVGLEGGGT
ncbi:MAG: metalloregulator ArsR/SmtB family transcription factor [Nitrospirae bacterium]|nr:metalloregulator ArsR/SmtB family transcription factor [Nitrospirota bacterium]